MSAEFPKITEVFTRVDGVFVTSQYPNPITARPGQDVTLTCRAAVGEPAPEVKWYRQGEEVTENDRITLLGDGSLRIDDAELSDEDNYTCLSTNVIGSDSSIVWLAMKGKSYFTPYFLVA